MKLIEKFNLRQFGILLIIIGIFIPSILYPFTSSSKKSSRLQDLEVVFVNGIWKAKQVFVREYSGLMTREEREKLPGYIDSKDGDGHYEGRIAFPYKYPMAFGILLTFIGIGFVALSKNNKTNYD